jgi:3-oxoacyl-[acyl-carrier protein] reductase
MKEEDWNRVLSVNLSGVYNCTKAVSRYMIQQKHGSIVNISSVAGQIGNPGQSNYAAAKAGVLGFTKSIARELASRNIRVNAIAPGLIKTEMTEKLSDGLRDKYLDEIPLSREGKPEEVAEATLFLLSDKASYITGEVLNVDGGLVMD